MMTQDNMLARYKVLHELGRGATGAVYAARDSQTGATVALKRLDPALLGKPDGNFAGRVLKQVHSARLLQHRNIARIHDAGEVAGSLYVAMELLEGESLRRILDAGPLPVSRAIQIARDIACGLAHAHLEGLVHGAVKPSNVIVLPSGMAKITDFGVGQAAPLPGPRPACPSYTAPEQLRGEPVDHRCDVYSLGTLFYEMLTHRPPVAGACANPSELNPHVPRALDGIVSSMLAQQPASRMAGVPIFLRELERLEEGLGLGSDPGAASEQASASVSPAQPEEHEHGNRMTERDAFDYQKAIELMDRESRPERASRSAPPVLAALTGVLGVLGIGLAAFMYHSTHPGELGDAFNRMQEALAGALPASRPVALAPVVETMQQPASVPVAPLPVEPSPVADATTEPAPAPAPAASTPEPPASAAAAAPAPELPRVKQPAAKVREQQPGGTARLILAVSPRGDIYIDGKHHGTTPPITTFDLEPGLHRIEVRSGSRTPYLTYMTVQAGDVRRIRHDFDTSRAVFPRRSALSQNR